MRALGVVAFAAAAWTCVTTEGLFVPNGRISFDRSEHRRIRWLYSQKRGKCRAMAAKMQSDEGGDQSAPDFSSDERGCWNPTLRRLMGSLALIGASETAFLTAKKLLAPGDSLPFCGAASDGIGPCSSVLDGPYATLSINGTNLPLSGLGFVAYALLAVLCLAPLAAGTPAGGKSDGDEPDVVNRVLIVCLATAMATFSSFLMSLLFGVLHESCPYCVLSASLSLVLGTLSWTAGVVPPLSSTRLAVPFGATSCLAATAASVGLFFSASTSNLGLVSSPLMASARPSPSAVPLEQMAPPPITTTSSLRAKALASNLASLNSRMFGAYWCNHCYDQKQALGREAMARIPYVECSRDGANSQTDLCKGRHVPGYPTWEIAGKLYPGEQDIEELEEIVQKAMK